MKIRCRLLLSLLFVFALASPIRAQNPGPYLGVTVGAQILTPAKVEDRQGTFNLEYRPAVSAGVLLGWELKPGSKLGEGRIELEYMRRSNRLDQAEFEEGKVKGGGCLRANSLLVNTFGVYRNSSLWTPYLGVGLGIAEIVADDLTITGVPLADDDALVFAYQFGAGVDVELTPSLILDFGYRLFSSSKAKFKESNGDEYKSTYLSHSAMAGLRFSF